MSCSNSVLVGMSPPWLGRSDLRHRDDPIPGACRATPLVLPTLVITEVAYLIGTRLGWQAEVRFLGDLGGGSFPVEPLHASDPVRIAELVAEYRDLPLGTVDASVIATAERLVATEVATLDRRHFSVVRPRHEVAFQLLP